MSLLIIYISAYLLKYFTLSDTGNVDATLVSFYLSVFCFFFVSIYLIVDYIEYIKTENVN